MDAQQPAKLNRRTFLMAVTAGLIKAGLAPLLWLQNAAAVAQESFEPFRFAFISDVHLTNSVPDTFKLTNESQLFLQELVKELNQENLDFVMFGGDQVESMGKDECNWQLFLEILQGLTVPWAFVPGEADVSGSTSVDKMKAFGADLKAAGIDTATPYWSHNLSKAPNVHMIGLDTSMPNTNVGGMSGRQMDWLKKDLEENKQFFTIIFCHHPLLPPPPYDGGPPFDDYVIPDGGAVREIIGAYPNVRMVISGHLHVSKVQQEKNVWHISSPSLAVFPCAYRIFTVAPESVTMETRVIQFPALVKKARKELIMSSIADRYSRSNPAGYIDVVQGEAEDWNVIIPMAAGQQLELYTPKKQKRKEEPVQNKPQQSTAQAEPQATKRSKWRKRSKGTTAPSDQESNQSSPAIPEPDAREEIDTNKLLDELIAPGATPAQGGK